MMFYVKILYIFILFAFRKYLCYVSDLLVYLHFKLTPRRSTEYSFREMILEEIRYRQRRVDQKCYKIYTKMLSLGVDCGVVGFDRVYEMKPEDVRHSEKDFENEL